MPACAGMTLKLPRVTFKVIWYYWLHRPRDNDLVPTITANDSSSTKPVIANEVEQSIFFQVIAAKDGLLRCARNDGVRDAWSHCQGLLV